MRSKKRRRAVCVDAGAYNLKVGSKYDIQGMYGDMEKFVYVLTGRHGSVFCPARLFVEEDGTVAAVGEVLSV